MSVKDCKTAPVETAGYELAGASCKVGDLNEDGLEDRVLQRTDSNDNPSAPEQGVEYQRADGTYGPMLKPFTPDSVVVDSQGDCHGFMNDIIPGKYSEGRRGSISVGEPMAEVSYSRDVYTAKQLATIRENQNADESFDYADMPRGAIEWSTGYNDAKFYTEVDRSDVDAVCNNAEYFATEAIDDPTRQEVINGEMVEMTREPQEGDMYLTEGRTDREISIREVLDRIGYVRMHKLEPEE